MKGRLRLCRLVFVDDAAKVVGGVEGVTSGVSDFLRSLEIAKAAPLLLLAIAKTTDRVGELVRSAPGSLAVTVAPERTH